MKIFALVATLLLYVSSSMAAPQATEKAVTAIIKTSRGDITLALYPDKAPLSVANFIAYAESGHYNGTIFHRVIKRFMIQGGGFDSRGVQKATRDPIANESKNGLHNDRGTIAMARTNDPDSATSQFYINLSFNSSLDPRSGKPGYAVFGEVTDGFYVVQDIGKQPTVKRAQFQNLPAETITIESVTIVK